MSPLKKICVRHQDITSKPPSSPLQTQPNTQSNTCTSTYSISTTSATTINSIVTTANNSDASFATAFEDSPEIVSPTTTTTAPTASTNAAVVDPKTDFATDPFKDYRYEDPFNIIDPFDDDVVAITGTYIVYAVML